MVMAMLLGMCGQLTFNQFMASLVNPFAEKCPNYCSAIRLPDDVLASRTITIPLVRSIDEYRAKAEPLDHELWPHDRTPLIDDLWALALANLATLRKFDAKAAQDARLNGRELEPWRAILAVAAWLDSHDAAGELQQVYHDPEDKDPKAEQMGGLFARLEALSVAYQEERSDLEAYDPTRLLIKGLQAMSAKHLEDPIEFYTSELTAEINALALEEEIAVGAREHRASYLRTMPVAAHAWCECREAPT